MIVRQRNTGIARVHVIPRRRGIGDAAASDAFRGNAPSSGNIPWPTWPADNSWINDPAGQALLNGFPGRGIDDSQTMYADGWRSSFDQNVSPQQMAGRVAPNQTQLGISKAQTGCSYDMQLTIGQYWAALKAYNAGTWQPPASQCGGPQNPDYGPQSSTLYPNIYISPTWTASDTPSGVTDADVQAQYKANEAAAVAAQSIAASGSSSGGTSSTPTPVPTPTPTPTTSDWFSGSMISGIPNWALLAAGGLVAFLAFGGKRR